MICRYVNEEQLRLGEVFQVTNLDRPLLCLVSGERWVCNKRESGRGAFIRNVDSDAYVVVSMGRHKVKDGMKHPRVRWTVNIASACGVHRSGQILYLESSSSYVIDKVRCRRILCMVMDVKGWST